MPVSKLLDDDDKKTIDSLLEAAPELEAELNRAKLAGLDVSEIEDRFKASTTKIRGIKTAFFPNE